MSYTLQLSMDGVAWGAPVVQTAGETPTTIATFRPAPAKFLRITQTGTPTDSEAWAIQQLRVYEMRREPDVR